MVSIINQNPVKLTSKCYIRVESLFRFTVIPKEKLEYEESDLNITKLYLGDSKHIELFDPVKLADNSVIIYPRYITKAELENGETCFILDYDKPNITSYFLALLLLNYNQIEQSSLFTLGFYSYMGIPPQKENTLYQVLRYGSNISMKYEHRASNHPSFVRSFDLDKHYITIEYKIPDSLIEDVNKIKKGKYSLISESSKERILNFYKKADPEGMSPEKINKSKIYGILYKTDSYRNYLNKMLNTFIPKNLELGQMWDYYKESFLIDKMLDNDTTIKWDEFDRSKRSIESSVISYPKIQD